METISKSPRTSIDRFSSLPDHVAHQVLSYVSIEDISRLSLVSRRLRELCISVPYLIFDVIPYRNDAVKRARLINYLDRLLFLRKGMDTQRLYIRWCLQNGLVDEEYRILSWLQSAVICNIELLDLDIILVKEVAEFSLPPSVVSCRSLRFLRVNLRGGTLNIPSPITTSGFCSLHTMSVQSVRINDSFGEWISTYCKFLKELCLEDIRGTKSIVITSSSLEILKILSPHDLFTLQVSAEMLGRMALRWRFDSPANRVLQLSAPKLKSMFWEGNILYFRRVETFMHLNTAGIFFRPSSDISASTSENLVRVLCSVCNIKVLALHDKCIRVLYEHGCLPTLFTYLLTLHIFTAGISKDFVPAHWLLDKLSGAYAPKPSQGPHKQRDCLPLIVFLRNRLKYALNGREVTQIVMQRLIKVDNKVRTDPNYPAGFMDVISIDKTGEHFRLIYDTKGRFAVHRVEATEAEYKLGKVKRVQLGRGGIPFLVTHDARTIRYPDPMIKVNDTVKIDLATGKITEFIQFDTGVIAMVTGGRNMGRVGVITHRERHDGGFNIVHIKDAVDNSFATRESNVFIIGKEKPWVSLPKGKGVKLSIAEERDRRRAMQAAGQA